MNVAMHMHWKMVYYALNLLIVKTSKQNRILIIFYIIWNKWLKVWKYQIRI